jgi:hypothetical protein
MHAEPEKVTAAVVEEAVEESLATRLRRAREQRH